MLNYAYGVLIARTQVQLIAEGYDPTIGILHGRESELRKISAFALDRMEPMRPVVDRAVLEAPPQQQRSLERTSRSRLTVCADRIRSWRGE